MEVTRPLLVILYLSLVLLVSGDIGAPYPGCPQECGTVRISYPFGIGVGCSLPGFEVSCVNQTLFLSRLGLQVIGINQGNVVVDSRPFLYSGCSDFGVQMMNIDLQRPFSISRNLNRFIVVGCNVAGIIIDQSDQHSRKSECKSFCDDDDMDSQECTGGGCCEVLLPRVSTNKLRFFTYRFEPIENIISSPCSYGFVVQEGSYIYQESDSFGFFNNRNISFLMTLAWGIDEQYYGNGLCGNNSTKYGSKENEGYSCMCNAGYEGNPYLNGSGGCQDISSCNHIPENPCVAEASCQFRTPTFAIYGFTCTCPNGTTGNGYKLGQGCRKRSRNNKIIFIYVILNGELVCWILLLCWVIKRRLLSQKRSKHFLQNGGLVLQQHLLSSKDIKNDHATIFTAEELEKATNNFDGKHILGQGGQGTVYKGVLGDGSIVAVKKSQSMTTCHVDKFINELIILNQINHRHIVKLIGSCLETHIPLLVYEFISGGTLYEKLHKKSEQLTWRDRLRISIEVGEALSYLHSYASKPIFHRDVKSSNILLNGENAAKLADFGLSRLVSLDKGRVMMCVQGTIGYLDPEYFITGNLTEKSDVYSFGVVLLELLTGRKPIRHEDARDYSSLVIYFKSFTGRENFFDVLDTRIVEMQNLEEMMAVSRIASRCLNVNGIERPTMKNVVQQLQAIQR